MGAWDAMGRGISSGVQAWLERIRQAEAAKQRATDEAFREKQFGLLQAGQRESLSQYEDERALEEQLRHKAELGALDPRSDLSRNIYIPMFENGIPLSEEEKTRRYQEGVTAWEATQAELSEQEYQRRLEEIEHGARMGHKYSYPPGHIAAAEQEAPSFFLPSGEVNYQDAYAFLQNWIERKGGDPRTNPDLLELFLQDIVLQFGRDIPKAREKAEQWLLQQTAQTTAGPEQPPRALTPHPVFEQMPSSIPGTPDIEKEMPQSLGGGIPWPTSPITQPAQPFRGTFVDKLRGLFGGREKTLEDFIAEIRAENPFLAAQPGALENAAQARYQEYLRNR